MGWNVVHRHLTDASDLDAHFHGGRAGEQIQVAGLEGFFVAVKRTRVLLAGGNALPQ